jgi:hypothetical protein
MINDAVNSFFEIGGGVVVWSNVRRLLKDRKVRGSYWPTAGFFAAFGLWSLFFYSSLQQPLSVLGGLVMTSGNVTWFTLAFQWRRN